MGGSWTGLLFDNQRTGYDLALTWTFEIEFQEIRRDYGATPASLTIDWVRAPIANWKDAAPREIECAVFAEPVESSVYFFAHHRYDGVELELVDQRNGSVDVRVMVQGDIDGLGLEKISAAATLEFGGIYVQTSTVGTNPTAAMALLAKHTDVAALRPTPNEHNVIFLPA